MAANMFLKFEPDDGLKGESTQSGFEDQIEILSFSWGVSQAGGFSYGTGGGVSKANLQDLSLSFRQCAASPSIMENCATGKHLDKATLSCLKAGGTQELYMTIELEDVIISSYQTGGSGDDVAIESMTLNFSKVSQKYLEQSADGQTVEKGTGKWNQLTASNS
jgi:type VI secretion system secreted protein Hcp